LRFELAQMCYYINIEITRSSSFFLIFYTPIYYIINIKSTYKIPHENPHMRPHTYAMTIRTHIEIRILNHWVRQNRHKRNNLSVAVILFQYDNNGSKLFYVYSGPHLNYIIPWIRLYKFSGRMQEAFIIL
jgi:hypothetical protein